MRQLHFNLRAVIGQESEAFSGQIPSFVGTYGGGWIASSKKHFRGFPPPSGCSQPSRAVHLRSHPSLRSWGALRPAQRGEEFLELDWLGMRAGSVSVSPREPCFAGSSMGMHSHQDQVLPELHVAVDTELHSSHSLPLGDIGRALLTNGAVRLHSLQTDRGTSSWDFNRPGLIGDCPCERIASRWKRFRSKHETRRSYLRQCCLARIAPCLNLASAWKTGVADILLAPSTLGVDGELMCPCECRLTTRMPHRIPRLVPTHAEVREDIILQL